MSMLLKQWTTGLAGGKNWSSHWTPQALALFAAMPTQPDDIRKALINDTIAGLIADGVWDKIKLIQIFHAHSPEASLINWKNPGTFDSVLAGLPGGYPTFIENSGWTGSAGAGWLDTQFNCLTNLAQNDSFIAAGVGTDTAAGDKCVLGAYTATGTVHTTIYPKYTGDLTLGGISNDNFKSFANTDAIGHYLNNRTVATSCDLWRNGVKNTIADNSKAQPNCNLYVFARNNDGTGSTSYSDHLVTYIAAGDGLTDTQIVNFHKWMDFYFNSVAVFMRGGVMLNFYDYFIDDWENAQTALASYNWRANFFVTLWNTFTQRTKDRFLALQTYGHQLGCHTRDNVNWYDGAVTEDQYINEQVINGIALMEADGVNVQAFGPAGKDIPFSLADRILAETSAKTIPVFDWGLHHDYSQILNYNSAVHKRAGGGNKPVYYNGYLDATTIIYNKTYLDGLIDWADTNKKVVILSGHKTVTSLSGGLNETLISDIVDIATKVNAKGMRWYQLSDIAQISNNEIPTKPNLIFNGYSGTFSEGGVIEVTGGTSNWHSAVGRTIVSVAFQWYRSDDVDGLNQVAISGATGRLYTCQAVDVGKYLSCATIAYDGVEYSEEALTYRKLISA